MKLRLVRLVKETDCKVTDRVSHVKLVLTMSEGKAEKESDCCGSHVKRVLTRMRGAKGTEEHVLPIRSMACGAPLLKDTMSAVKLREGLEASASDLVGYGGLHTLFRHSTSDRAVFEDKHQTLHVHSHNATIQMFRKQIRRVCTSFHFHDVQFSFLVRILKPQHRNVHMPQLPKSAG